MKFLNLFFTFFSLYSIFSYGQEEYYDASFGDNGRVLYDFGENHSEFGTILSHQNSLYGLIYYTGNQNSNQIIVKYDSEGNLDYEFGDGGHIVTNLNFQFWDWRSIFHGYLGITNDNKIIVITELISEYPLIGKFNLDGSLDNSYGLNGYAYSPEFESNLYTLNVKQLENDDIIIIGNELLTRSIVVAKFNNQGELITEFGDNGIIKFEYDHTQKNPILADFKEHDNSLYVVWDHNLDGSISKYDLNNLSLDTQFGENGNLLVNVNSEKNEKIHRFNVNENGEIIIAYFEDFNNHEGSFLVKYDVHQNIDTDFGNQGLSFISDDQSMFTKIIHLIDNFIYVIGEVDYGSTQFIKRFNENGTSDLNFGIQGTILRSNYDGDYLNNWVFDVSIAENTFITSGSCTLELGLYPNPCLNKFIINPDLNIQDFNYQILNLYPNPSNKFIYLTHKNLIKKIEIYNNLGQLIMLPKFDKDKIDISNLEKGTYYLKIIDSEKNIYKRRIIKK